MLFLYSTLTVSISILISLPSLTVACVFLELQRQWGFHFFGGLHGGSPLLWQQLFWFFGHPWVYVIFLLAMGMMSMVIPVFARRPIVGYPYVAISTRVSDIGVGHQRGLLRETGNRPHRNIDRHARSSAVGGDCPRLASAPERGKYREDHDKN